MVKKGEMTAKQKKFCDEYIKSGNAADAARRAGYSHKSAEKQGQENLHKPLLRAYIDAQLDALHQSTIADAEEVLRYLTSVVRGETTSHVLALVGEGRQEVIEKPPDERERTKAAELLARRYGLLTDKVNLEGSQPVLIIGDAEIAE